MELTWVPTGDQQCSCAREKRCSCAIKRELLGPISEAPKRGIKRPRSSTETEKDKARPRGLSATNSDPNLQILSKKHKPAHHRYSHSGQESSTYYGRPQSQHASAAFSPISMDSVMASNGAFLLGRRPQSLQAFSPYSESMDSLSSLPYDLHRPMLHGIPSYSSDSVETFSTLPRDNLPYDIQRPRSIHGQAPFAHKLDGFAQMREGTPQFYADSVALEERRVRSAHTSPGPAPAGKLERYANQYPHLEIPSYAQNHGNITSSPVGDDYGQQRYGMEYVSPTEGPGSVAGEPPNMPVADWTPLDLPLNHPGAFTTSAAQSHASSYTSFDPGLLAQQPGLTDASSGDVSEADDYAQHASVASPSAAATSPFVQAAVAPYGVSAASDPYVDMPQSTVMDASGQVHGLPAEPYLHRAAGSPIDRHTEYTLTPKAEADPYPHPPHHVGLPADMAHSVTPQPTSDPSWVDTSVHNGSAGAYVMATSAQGTGDPLWVASQVDDGTGHMSPHHSQTTSDPSWAGHYVPTEAEAVKLSPRMVAAAAARMQAAAHDSASPDPSPTSRNQSPYAAALQPTSDPTWAATAAVAAAHDPVGVPQQQQQQPPQPSPSPVNAALHSRHNSPHPHGAPTSDPTWIAVSQGLDMASVAAMQQRQATPPNVVHGDMAQKLGQQQQRAWSPAAAAAYAEQQQQQQARFSAGSSTPGGSSHAQYPYDA